jgi:hypothetical protein
MLRNWVLPCSGMGCFLPPESGAGLKRILHKDPDSKRGDWIFDRESLDAYRLRQLGNEISDREKTLVLVGDLKPCAFLKGMADIIPASTEAKKKTLKQKTNPLSAKFSGR